MANAASSNGAFREVPISDLMDEFHDGPHATPKPARSGPVFLGIKNITPDGRLDLSTIRHIDESDFARWTRRVVPKENDLVFTYEATMHRYALIPRGFRGCLGRRLALIRPRLDVVDPRFLHLALRGPEWRRTVEDRVISGATVDRVPLIDFPAFPISIPGLDVQRRIVAVLGSLDELIEINQRRIELLEDLALVLYREWFVRFRFPGNERSTMAASELGPIPVGWEIASVAEMASPERSAISSGPFGSKLGRKDYVEAGVPVIRGTNLAVGGGFVDEGFVFVSEDKAATLRSSIALPGDVVITQRGTLGQVGLVPADARFPHYVISQSQMKITTGPATSRQYLYSVFRAPEATERIVKMAVTAGVPYINLSLLREMRVLVPPSALQMEFEARVAPMSELVGHLRRANSHTNHVRDLLLPRLVTGRLDISDIDLGDLLLPEQE